MNEYKAIEIEIDGEEFAIAPFGYKEAKRIFTKLVKIITPILGSVLKGFNGKDMNEFLDTEIELQNVDFSSFSEVFISIADKIDEDEFDDITDRLLSCVVHKGKKLEESQANFLFNRNLTLMYKLLFEILKINFADFFGLAESFGSQMKTIFSTELLSEKKEKQSTN